MPLESVQTVTAAMNVAKRLANLRHAYGEAAAEVIQAERELTYARAVAEQQIIIHQAGGDEKKLGTNEDARRRAFTLELEQVNEYVDARTSLGEAEADRRIFEVELKLAQDQLAILLAALEAGLTDLPADLFDDREADE